MSSSEQHTTTTTTATHPLTGCATLLLLLLLLYNSSVIIQRTFQSGASFRAAIPLVCFCLHRRQRLELVQVLVLFDSSLMLDNRRRDVLLEPCWLVLVSLKRFRQLFQTNQCLSGDLSNMALQYSVVWDTAGQSRVVLFLSVSLAALTLSKRCSFSDAL